MHMQYTKNLELVLVFLNDFNRIFEFIHLAWMSHQ